MNTTSTPDQNAALTAAMAAYGIFFVLFIIGAIVLSVVIYWRIAAKAGFNGALSLLMLVPLVNFLIVLVFAFTEWPVERELKLARSGGYGGPGFGGGGGGGGGGGWQQPQPPVPPYAPPQQPQIGTWGPPTQS